MKRKIDIIFAAIFTLLLFSSCYEREDYPYNAKPFSIKMELSNTLPAIGEVVVVEAVPYKGEVSKIDWSWGDGTTSNENISRHEYAQDGTYTISMEAVGNNGKIFKDSREVTVEGVGLTHKIKNFDRSKVWILAHRSNTTNPLIPENSMEAVEAAIAQAEYLDMIEIDPRSTKDGVIILMHDETVDRTTTGTGRVKDLTYAEIKALRLKLSDGTVTEYLVPTLQDVMLKIRGKLFINHDFMNKVPTKEMFDAVKNNGMLDRSLFTIGQRKEVMANMLNYAETIHILGQYSGSGDDKFLNEVGGGARVSFSYTTLANTLNTGFMPLMYNQNYITTTIMLNQGGYTFDKQMMSGDYSGVDAILAKNALFIQTDNPKTLHDYLKTKGKR